MTSNLIIILVFFLGLISAGLFCLQSIKRGILFLLFWTGLAIGSFPWQLLQADVQSPGASLYAIVMAAAWAYAGLTGRLFQLPSKATWNLLIVVLFSFLLLVFLTLSDFNPYGIEKTWVFAFKVLLPSITLSLLAPYDKGDCQVICAALVYAAFLMGLNVTLFSDYYSQRELLGGDIGTISVSRILCLGVFVLLVGLASISKGAVYRWPIQLAFSAILASFALVAGSRGPLLSCLLGAALVLTLVRVKSKLLRPALFTLVCVGVLLTVLFAERSQLDESVGFQRLWYYYEAFEAGTSDYARFHLMKEALNGFLHSGGIGLGTGGFADWLMVEREWPHNIFLEVLVELGIIGSALLICLLVLATKQWLSLVRSKDFSSGASLAVASMWIYFLLNAFVSYDISGNYGFWIAAGLIPYISKGGTSIFHFFSGAVETKHEIRVPPSGEATLGRGDK